MVDAGDLLQAILTADSQISSTWQVLILVPLGVLGIFASMQDEVDKLSILARVLICLAVGTFLYLFSSHLFEQYERLELLKAAYGNIKPSPSELQSLRTNIVENTSDDVVKSVYMVSGLAFFLITMILFSRSLISRAGNKHKI